MVFGLCRKGVGYAYRDNVYCMDHMSLPLKLRFLMALMMMMFIVKMLRKGTRELRQVVSQEKRSVQILSTAYAEHVTPF